jgi:O-antigen/teichoic acid export membrane protein
LPERSQSQLDDRDETPLEKLDRQWNELLQELRVSQTGVQLLTAFLLSLPFQQRFQSITHAQRALYLVIVVLSLVATGLLLAPVSMHRRVFRQHERGELVEVANVLAQAGLAALGLALAGVATLIFYVTEGQAFGIIVGVITLAALTGLWFVAPHFFPRLLKMRRSRQDGSAH